MIQPQIKTWLSKKGMTLKSNTLKDMPNIPIDFEYEVTDLNWVVDRSKSFDYLLKLWWSILENTQKSVTAAVLSKFKVVKAHISQKEQFLEKQYVAIGSIFTKQSDDFFRFKRVCGAGLKKQNRMIFMGLTKADRSVAYSYFQCPAGSVEHFLMHLLWWS